MNFKLVILLAMLSAKAVALSIQRRDLGGWIMDYAKDGFTEEEKTTILNRHNELRKSVEATNMNRLEWDNTMEAVAQDWANGCSFTHNYNNNYGENLAVVSTFYNPLETVNVWHSEKQYYTYGNNSCEAGHVCGHYTQIVLAESRRIGCGIKYCGENMTRVTITKAYYTVCVYDPAENKGSSVPYEEGDICTNCDSGRVCVVGMCDNPPATTQPTSTTTTTLAPTTTTTTLAPTTTTTTLAQTTTTTTLAPTTTTTTLAPTTTTTTLAQTTTATTLAPTTTTTTLAPTTTTTLAPTTTTTTLAPTTTTTTLAPTTTTTTLAPNTTTTTLAPNTTTHVPKTTKRSTRRPSGKKCKDHSKGNSNGKGQRKCEK